MKSRKIFERVRNEDRFRQYPPDIMAAFRRWIFYRYLNHPKDLDLTMQEIQIVKDHPDLAQYIEDAMQQFVSRDNPIRGHLALSVIWHQEEFKGERVAWAPWFLQLPEPDLQERYQRCQKIEKEAQEGFGLLNQ